MPILLKNTGLTVKILEGADRLPENTPVRVYTEAELRRLLGLLEEQPAARTISPNPESKTLKSKT